MNPLRRLWDSSPRQITQAVLRRSGLVPAADPLPEWHTVGAGPLAGAELYLAPRAVDTWAAMVAGSHDRFLFDAIALRRSLGGAVCWDVGAHLGYHALAFAALVGPGGRVVAFEPNPANLARLAMHLARNPVLAGRVTVQPMALSDTVGVTGFRSSAHVESGMSSGGHLAAVRPPNDLSSYKQFQVTEVESSTMDRLVGSGALPAPDVVKVDVEGAESAVLKGGRDVIRAARPLLLIEVHHILQMLEISELLRDWGYRIAVLDHEHATAGRCFILAEPRGDHE
jgi:FkbM family methyltransferase